MSLSIDELFTPPTEDEIKATIYSLATSLGLSTTSWQAGSPIRTVIAIVAKLISGTSQLFLTGIKMGFLDDSVGDPLTLIARLIYGVDRVEATFASGSVTLTNAGGGVYVEAVGDVVFKNTTTGKTYFNTAPFTLGALGTATVTVQATEVGTDSNASPGQIDDLVTTLLGVTVSNALAVVGEDAETDDALRLRCREALGALSPNGPAAAYEFVATTPSLNGGVAVTRVSVLPSIGNGEVDVIIAGPDGALSGGDVLLVQEGIDENAVPESVTANVESAANVDLTVTADVYVLTTSGLDSGEVTDLVTTALVDYIPTQPIGGNLLQGGPARGIAWRALEAVGVGASPFIQDVVLSPETDSVLSSNEIARLAAIDVTLTIHFVSP